MARTKKRPKTARAIAEEAAREWYETVLESPEVADPADLDLSPLDVTIEEITQMIEAAELRRHGPFEDDDEMGASRENSGRQAGYIVGVQVGLLLRAATERS